VLHAGGAKDRAKRARCAALLADDLADIGGSHFEPEHSRVLVEDDLNFDGCGVVYKGLCDLTYESADL
jgi:hypothetical protein